MGQFAEFLDKVDVCLSTKGSAATKQCGEIFGPQAGAFGEKIKNGCDLLLSATKNAVSRYLIPGAASRDLVPGATKSSKPSCAKPGRDYMDIRRLETGYEVREEPTSCATRSAELAKRAADAEARARDDREGDRALRSAPPPAIDLSPTPAGPSDLGPVGAAPAPAERIPAPEEVPPADVPQGVDISTAGSRSARLDAISANLVPSRRGSPREQPLGAPDVGGALHHVALAQTEVVHLSWLRPR